MAIHDLVEKMQKISLANHDRIGLVLNQFPKIEPYTPGFFEGQEKVKKSQEKVENYNVLKSECFEAKLAANTFLAELNSHRSEIQEQHDQQGDSQEQGDILEQEQELSGDYAPAL